jgi:osomolarity two-component system, sensor histidine kinase TcsA
MSQTPEVDNHYFRYLVQSLSDHAVCSLDLTGTITSWNQGAERINGYKAEEIVGKHFSTLQTQESFAEEQAKFELEQALKNGSYEEQYWRVKKDGARFWANVVMTAIYDDENNLLGFANITRDFTQKKLAEDKANAARIALMANLTHDIRTPLSGILGLSEIISNDEAAEEQTRENGTRILEASKQLLRIVNDLLDLAKLEAGKMDVERISFSVGDVVDAVQGLCMVSASNKGLAFTVAIDPNIPKEIIGDPSKIRQVLLNLVSNAIKFTTLGGVQITVRQETNCVIFSITDTGIGISDAAKGRLFQPFVQGESSTQRLFGGTGLGLSIAHQCVELMGGELGFRSKSGIGTKFWFSVPC